MKKTCFPWFSLLYHNSVLLTTPSKVFYDDFVTITLKLSTQMAYRVYDEFASCEVLSDGSFKATHTMPRGEWIYTYLATFGEHCEVLEPSDIRLQIKEKLQKTLNQYL
jgi:predicted DNA-binding transcriptional regulator YafY